MDMTSECFIDARGLVPENHAYPELPALNLSLGPRGATCLLGQSEPYLDCYLRALGGIIPLRSGELRLFGKSSALINGKERTMLRIKLSYISRGGRLVSVLNGMDNIILPALYHKLYSPSEAIQKARALLTELQFIGDTQALPAFNTPLQNTQLAIARAMILEPLVLLLNHPYYKLEINEQNTINQFLQKWCVSRPLLISTNNQRFVKDRAEWIVFLGEQNIYHFSSWSDLCQNNSEEVLHYLKHFHDE